MSRRLISATLALVDGEWVRDAEILVDGDQILAAGPAGSLVLSGSGAGEAGRNEAGDAEVDATLTREDWGDVAVLPGCVNGHGHTFQALVRGFGDDLPFGRWMSELVHPTAARLDRHAIGVGARFDFAEMLRMGITTAVEFFYVHDAANENAMAVIEAARSLGIRVVLARCMFDADPGPPRYRETPAVFEANFRELAVELADDPSACVQPAPHSVLGTSAEMLQLGSALASEYDTPLHIHVADNWGEVEVSRQRWNLTPVAYLDSLGVLDPQLLAVHAVAVDEDDLELLAASGASVVHNPSTNAFLGGGIAPLVAMLERGIPVCLGTDAAGANSRQSVFEEMRMAALLAKALARSGAAMTAEQVLALGTSAGGPALRRPVGSIAPGHQADFVVIDLEALSLQPRATVTHNLVYSMQPEAIARVIIGGEVVVEAGEIVGLDEAALRGEIAQVTASLRPVTGIHPLLER
jgi:5-methylthioadenosine/S-adenosylhomocysteine deaminase